MDSEKVIDPALGNATAIRLRSQLEQGQWQNAEAVLDKLRDWDERAFLVGALAEWPGRPAWLDDWYRKRSLQSSVPGLIRGAHSIYWAWEARGSHTGDKVAEDAWKVFYSRLQKAEMDLEEAAFKNMDDPTPWAFLITSGMGRQAGAELTGKRFEQAIRRDPDNRSAHYRMLGALTAKWGGSHEAMFSFAREATAKAPPGSSLHVMVPQAHIERWLAYALEKDNRGFAQYLRRPEVKQEILTARERFVQAAPAAPAFAAGEHNILAFALWKCGEQALAGEEIKAIGANLARLPWSLRGNPATVFAKARAECLGEGDETVTRKMAEASLRAVEAAKEAEVALDFSWESLGAVDSLLRSYQARIAKVSEEKERNRTIFGVALAMGGYIGQVMKQRYGGCWINYSDDDEEFDPAFYTHGKYCHPMKVAAFIIGKGGAQTITDLVEQMVHGKTEPASMPTPPPPPPPAATASPAPSPDASANSAATAPNGKPASPSQTPAGSLSEIVQAAVLVVNAARQSKLGELNYDEASLPVLDQLIAGLRATLESMKEPEQRTNTSKFALAAGAYMGEVISRSGNGAWVENVAGAPGNLPVVNMGNTMAAVFPAALGLLTDGATKMGPATAISPSEYYRELVRLQKAWLQSRLCGEGTMEQLVAAVSDSRSLAAEVVNTVATAVLTASLKWGLDLDFSEASLEGLDNLIQHLHKPFEPGGGPPPTDEQVGKAAGLWGVYLGEVIRRNRGGRWSYRELPDGQRPLQIGSGEQGILPLSRVARQIRGGAEFSVRAFYRWTGGLDAPEGARSVPASPEILAFANHVAGLALTLMPGQGPMTPLLVVAKEGKINPEIYVGMATDKAIAMGRMRAADQPAVTEFVAVVYDGYISHQNEKKKDAILLETHQRGVSTGFIFGQTYVHQPDGKAAKAGELEEVSRCAPFLR
jgi:hypothetical protein